MSKRLTFNILFIIISLYLKTDFLKNSKIYSITIFIIKYLSYLNKLSSSLCKKNKK